MPTSFATFVIKVVMFEFVSTFLYSIITFNFGSFSVSVKLNSDELNIIGSSKDRIKVAFSGLICLDTKKRCDAFDVTASRRFSVIELITHSLSQ